MRVPAAARPVANCYSRLGLLSLLSGYQLPYTLKALSTSDRLKKLSITLHRPTLLSSEWLVRTEEASPYRPCGICIVPAHLLGLCDVICTPIQPGVWQCTVLTSVGVPRCSKRWGGDIVKRVLHSVCNVLLHFENILNKRWYLHIYTVSEKTSTFYFLNNSVKN